MSNPTNAITVSEYMHKPEALARFTAILGDSGKAYVQSVLIAVSGSEELKKCTPQSIMGSALRAASLGLSCDPALKQAWLVPYNKKQKDGTWTKEAQFQPHYKGLYTLAMRTGKYLQMNVSPVYEGQKVLENSLTGLHAVMEASGLIGEPDAKNPAYTDVTVRRKKDLKVIGWIGYFKTKKGFEKSVWMSSAEIDDHARKYVKDYDKNPNWNDADKRQVMEMKTVLRQLLSWADMSGIENTQLVEALNADEGETIDVESVEAQEPQGMDYKTASETVLKFGDKSEKFMSELTADQLNAVIAQSGDFVQVEAAKIVLMQDFQMEPVQTEPRPKEKNLKDLGF